MKPVAKDWYETRSLGDGVTLIREIHVAPWLRCNIWHVRGRDRDLIVDTGMGLRPLKVEVPRLTERPLAAIQTHTHFDHVGGLHQFDDRRGHAAEAEIIARPTWANTVVDTGYWVEDSVTALPFEGFEVARYRVRPAPFTGHLDEGDVVDLGDRAFRVLHLPGHSPGSIVLWEQATGVLFSGDVLYDGALLDELYHSDRAAYRVSLARLRELPVRTVHGGHFRSFGAERMRALVDGYLADGAGPGAVSPRGRPGTS